jgi:hypothetical protein
MGKIIPEDSARRMVGYARAQGWLPPEAMVVIQIRKETDIVLSRASSRNVALLGMSVSKKEA